jgi:glucokinase
VNYVVAVDVGGTHIKSALVDSNFTILETLTSPTPKADTDGSQTVLAIEAIVLKFSQRVTVKALGLAVPGALDEPAGKSRWSGNLQWRDLPIRDLLQKKIGIPVAFGHDVRSGALAEMRNGAAKGAQNAIFIPVGTGIAAALIIDGQIRSADGFAGEIGHINVGSAALCVCGKIGCLEATSSALAISKKYEEISGKTFTSTEDIFTLVQSHDPLATQVWNEAASAMAQVCETLITILAPEIIIFGGGVSNAGAGYISPIREYLDSALTFQKVPRLEIAHFGSKAGTIGCAIMAFDLLNSPSTKDVVKNL